MRFIVHIIQSYSAACTGHLDVSKLTPPPSWIYIELRAMCVCFECMEPLLAPHMMNVVTCRRWLPNQRCIIKCMCLPLQLCVWIIFARKVGKNIKYWLLLQGWVSMPNSCGNSSLGGPFQGQRMPTNLDLYCLPWNRDRLIPSSSYIHSEITFISREWACNITLLLL